MKFLALEYVADNDDAHLIKQNHRYGEQRLRDNIRRGRDYSGDDKGHKNNVALKFHEHFRADDVQISQKR